MDGESEFARVLAESLRVVWREGAVHDSPAGTCTGWRIMPTMVSSVLLEGRSLLEIDGQPPREYRGGMAVSVPEGVHHRVTNLSRGISAWSHLTFRVFGTVDVLSLVEVPPVLSGEPARRLGEINRQLAEVPAGAQGVLAQVCARQALGLALLQILIDASTPTPRSGATLAAILRLAPLLAAIEDDLGAIDAPRLARLARLSSSRLHAVFSEAFGCSPMAYVRRRRLQRARELLASTGLAIGEVAERSGYDDQFHFSRAFKQVHGVSPSEYREQMRAAML